MDKKNVMLAGVATAIIVTCLLFSFVQYGDPEEDRTWRTGVELGDYVTYDITVTSGGTVVDSYEQRTVVAEIYTLDRIIVNEYVDGELRDSLTMTADEFNADIDIGPAIGSERIVTGYGELECSVHLLAVGDIEYRMWAYGDVVYRMSYTDASGTYTGTLKDTSFFSEPTVFDMDPVGIPLEAGDWMEWEGRTTDLATGDVIEEFSYRTTIVSAEGDVLVVENSTGGVMTSSVEEYLTGLPDGLDRNVTCGRLIDTPFGERIVHQTNVADGSIGYISMIGENGVSYRIVSVDGSSITTLTLSDTSIFL